LFPFAACVQEILVFKAPETTVPAFAGTVFITIV
jgi:hypothetical protein